MKKEQGKHKEAQNRVEQLEEELELSQQKINRLALDQNKQSSETSNVESRLKVQI